MESISLKLEKNFLQDIEKTMRKFRYATKTEFIRQAIRDKIIDLKKEELLLKAKSFYGASNRQTTDKQLHKAREKAFIEVDNQV